MKKQAIDEVKESVNGIKGRKVAHGNEKDDVCGVNDANTDDSHNSGDGCNAGTGHHGGEEHDAGNNGNMVGMEHNNEISEEEPDGDRQEAISGDDPVTGNIGENRNDTEEEGKAPAESRVDIEALIAEAEARGYERARNERIEQWLAEGKREHVEAGGYHDCDEVMILNNIRPSVWER